MLLVVFVPVFFGRKKLIITEKIKNKKPHVNRKGEWERGRER
jgi:hypothetical protein